MTTLLDLKHRCSKPTWRDLNRKPTNGTIRERQPDLAIAYAEWLALRDRIEVPERSMGEWNGRDYVGAVWPTVEWDKTIGRIRSVKWLKSGEHVLLEIPIPHWDWTPDEPKDLSDPVDFDPRPEEPPVLPLF